MLRAQLKTQNFPIFLILPRLHVYFVNSFSVTFTGTVFALLYPSRQMAAHSDLGSAGGFFCSRQFFLLSVAFKCSARVVVFSIIHSCQYETNWVITAKLPCGEQMLILKGHNLLCAFRPTCSSGKVKKELFWISSKKTITVHQTRL